MRSFYHKHIYAPGGATYTFYVQTAGQILHGYPPPPPLCRTCCVAKRLLRSNRGFIPHGERGPGIRKPAKVDNGQPTAGQARYIQPPEEGSLSVCSVVHTYSTSRGSHRMVPGPARFVPSTAQVPHQYPVYLGPARANMAGFPCSMLHNWSRQSAANAN